MEGVRPGRKREGWVGLAVSSEMGFAADARGGEEAQVEIYIYICIKK